MGIKKWLRGRTPTSSRSHSAASNERFAEIQQRLLTTARNQSFQLKIVKEQEASLIAQLCGFADKRHNSPDFVDVALILLCLPSELGFVVGMEFTNFAHLVGFQPFGTIMVSVGHIDSMYRPMIMRKSLIDQKPERDELLNSRNFRIEKAAKLLTVGLFISCQSVADAKNMYQNMSADAVIKNRIGDEVGKMDEELAHAIIGT